jgi:plastocyanin
VTTRDFAFSPSTLSADAGVVQFSASNADGSSHTFTVSGTDVHIPLAANASGSDSATLAAGSYEFHCNIHGSMTGTLTVS